MSWSLKSVNEGMGRRVLALSVLCLHTAQLRALRLGSRAHGPASEHEIECGTDVTNEQFEVTSMTAEYFKSKNITVQPWALTAVSALRFGGGSALIGNNMFTMDHDFDFRVHTKSNLVYENLGLFEGFREYLRVTRNVRSTLSSTQSNPIGAPEYAQMAMFVQMRTPEGANLEKEQNVEKTHIREIHENPLAKTLEHHSSSHITDLASQVGGLLVRPLSSVESTVIKLLGVTFLDFWFGVPETMPSSQKILFAGVEFPWAPYDSFTRHLQEVVCSLPSAACHDMNTELKFCDWALPQYIPEEERMFKREAVSPVVKRCSQMLDAKHYASFAQCFEAV